MIVYLILIIGLIFYSLFFYDSDDSGWSTKKTRVLHASWVVDDVTYLPTEYDEELIDLLAKRICEEIDKSVVDNA